MEPTISRAKALDNRRAEMKVSYRELARRTGKSFSTILRVMTEKEHEYPTNRPAVLKLVAIALNKIEIERLEHETAKESTTEDW